MEKAGVELAWAREGTELSRAEGHVTGHPTFCKALHLLQHLPPPPPTSSGFASSAVKIRKYTPAWVHSFFIMLNDEGHQGEL